LLLSPQEVETMKFIAFLLKYLISSFDRKIKAGGEEYELFI